MQAHSSSAPHTEAEIQTGRLVGWLVSYGLDTRGLAVEIRTGRSLITSENGVQGSIHVSDNTISMPHAALHASPRHKVVLQDIFSEYGTYLLRSSKSAAKGAEVTGAEISVTGPTELAHGDWIRFGEKTRFQVCIIDDSRR